MVIRPERSMRLDARLRRVDSRKHPRRRVRWRNAGERMEDVRRKQLASWLASDGSKLPAG